MSIGELVGFAVGMALAPFAAVGSLVRRARVFHPEGVVYGAEVTPDTAGGPAREVANRLVGPAFVRLSGALWKGQKEWPDILGVSIRLRGDATVSPEPASSDQDLLFATVRSSWLLPLSPFTTNVHSFLGNEYHALGVFETAELGRVKLRLVPSGVPGGGRSRLESLERAAARGGAVFELQARPLLLGARYEPIARIRLVKRLTIDQEALRMSPFRAGRGIVAKGFLNAMRLLPYVASQLARAPRARGIERGGE